MEESYLYPGDSVKPVNVGHDYCDYLLSDILDYFGLKMVKPFIQMDYADGPVPSGKMAATSRRGLNVLLANLLVARGGLYFTIHLAPLACYRPYTEEAMLAWTDEDRERSARPAMPYTDLVLRYYLPGDEILVKRPVWVAMLDQDGGRYFSVGEPIAYCTDLLVGPLLMLLDNNFRPVNKLESNYLTYFE